jgi:hypothetical protein
MPAYLATKDHFALDAPSIADQVNAGVKKKPRYFEVTILDYGWGS